MFCKIFNSYFVLSLLCAVSLVACNPFQSDSLRLPNNSYPLKYDLWLKVNVENKSTFFEGRVKIHLKLLEESDSITIHSKDLFVKKIVINDLVSSHIHEDVSYRYEKVKDFLIINLPQKAASHSEYLIDIQYHGKMLEANDDEYFNNKGFQIASYLEANQTSENYIFTDLETSHARECLPCYDEPEIRAPFSLQIEHHSSYNAIANMPVISRVQVNKSTGYVITTFEETPKMQPYILAFVVSKFNYVQSNDLNIPQNVYARNTRIKNGDVDFIASKLDKMLTTFEEYFGVSFPLPKLDHVIAPHYYTAIENWGVIGYSERSVFKDDMMSNLRTFIHEIAHQYFGNLVSPKWWSYVWLNEGIANFYDIELELRMFPEEYDEIDHHRQESKSYSFMMDSRSNSQPLNKYVEHPEEISQKFSLLSYYKGAFIIHMFQEAFGVDTWRKGMKYYLEENKYGSVEPRDLHKALQRAVDEDYLNNSINIENLMSPWEDQAGYPLISVKLENKVLKMSQKRWLDDGEISSEIYSIPITYSTSSTPSFSDLKAKFWMLEKESEINNFTDDWIIFNNQRVGYYRIDYDENLWDAILDQLQKNYSVIHQTNRLSLFDSMSFKIDTDYFNETQILRMLSYMKHEDNLKVILASQLLLKKILKKETEYFEMITPDLKDVFEVVYEKIKLLTNANVIKAISCKLLIQKCLDDALSEMMDVLSNSTFNYDFSYCDGLKYANETIFYTVLNKTKALQHDQKGFLLLYGLGCVRNVELFEKLLNVFIDPEWNSNGEHPSAYAVLSNMDTNERIEILLEFLEKNYSKLYTETPTLLKDIIAHSALSIKSEHYISRLKNIWLAAKDIGT